MRGINKVFLIGNVGKDPELRYTSNSMAVTELSIATSEAWKDRETGEKKESVEWHNVVIYNKQAEIAGKYLRKGSKVYIDGKLTTKKWQDKETGKDRYKIQIVANGFQMLDGKGEVKETSEQEKPDPLAEPYLSDELPF